MDIANRKLELINKLLLLQSEEILIKIEQLLQNLNAVSEREVVAEETETYDPEFVEDTFTQDELEERLKISIEDYEKGHFKSTEDLQAKYAK